MTEHTEALRGKLGASEGQATLKVTMMVDGGGGGGDDDDDDGTVCE